MSFVVVPILLLALLWIVVRYIQYINSPRAVWSQRIRGVWTEIEQKLAGERTLLRNSARDEADAIGRLRASHLEEHLGAVPVDVVLRVSGIGPAVLDSLRRAGYRSLTDLRRGGFEQVDSVGPKRAGDLRQFLRTVLIDEEQRFDSAAAGPGGAFRKAASEAASHFDERKRRSEAKVRVFERAQADLAPIWKAAMDGTFPKFLFGMSSPPGEFEKLRNAAVPTMQSLEQEADRAFGELKNARPKAEAPGSSKGGPTASAPPVANSPLEAADRRSPPPPHRANGERGPAPAKAPAAAPVVSPEEALVQRCDSMVALLCAAGRSDGRLAKAEVDSIRRLATVRLGREPRTNNLVESSLAQYASGEIDVDRSLSRFRSIGTREEHSWLVADVRVVLNSSGNPNPRKAKYLRRIADALGVAVEDEAPPVEEQIAATTAPPAAVTPPITAPATTSSAPTEADQRSALEIPPGVELTSDLVRRQYRLLMEKYKPEKARNFGTDIEKAVTTKREAATAAATELMKRWGEPLEPPQAEAPADSRHNPDLDAIFGG